MTIFSKLVSRTPVLQFYLLTYHNIVCTSSPFQVEIPIKFRSVHSHSNYHWQHGRAREGTVSAICI